jgi:hypothetical protein
LRRGLGCNACETELLVQADRLVGGSDAVLVIDDTAIAKKGTLSVGVASAVEKNSASIISGTSQTFYRYRPKTMQALPGSALEVPTRAAGYKHHALCSPSPLLDVTRDSYDPARFRRTKAPAGATASRLDAP